MGSVLLVSGFLGYFNFVRLLDNSLSALLLIYGFPITLIGNIHSYFFEAYFRIPLCLL